MHVFVFVFLHQACAFAPGCVPKGNQTLVVCVDYTRSLAKRCSLLAEASTSSSAHAMGDFGCDTVAPTPQHAKIFRRSSFAEVEIFRLNTFEVSALSLGSLSSLVLVRGNTVGDTI